MRFFEKLSSKRRREERKIKVQQEQADKALQKQIQRDASKGISTKTGIPPTNAASTVTAERTSTPRRSAEARAARPPIQRTPGRPSRVERVEALKARTAVTATPLRTSIPRRSAEAKMAGSPRQRTLSRPSRAERVEALKGRTGVSIDSVAKGTGVETTSAATQPSKKSLFQKAKAYVSNTKEKISNTYNSLVARTALATGAAPVIVPPGKAPRRSPEARLDKAPRERILSRPSRAERIEALNNRTPVTQQTVAPTNSPAVVTNSVETIKEKPLPRRSPEARSIRNSDISAVKADRAGRRIEVTGFGSRRTEGVYGKYLRNLVKEAPTQAPVAATKPAVPLQAPTATASAAIPPVPPKPTPVAGGSIPRVPPTPATAATGAGTSVINKTVSGGTRAAGKGAAKAVRTIGVGTKILGGLAIGGAGAFAAKRMLAPQTMTDKVMRFAKKNPLALAGGAIAGAIGAGSLLNKK